MVLNFELKNIKLKDIKSDPTNPNKMTDEQLQALRYSLKKFGQLKPIILDQTMTICDGEHTLKALLAEGVEEAQCYTVDCTPAQRRLIRQTMNKLHGEHSYAKDIEEMQALLKDQQEQELKQLLPHLELDVQNLIDAAGIFNKQILDEYQRPEITKTDLAQPATAILNKPFMKPEFVSIHDQYQEQRTNQEKNENWFYIEYYAQPELFKALTAKLKFKNNSIHEIDPEWFKTLLGA